MQDKITLIGFMSWVNKIEGILPSSFSEVPEELFYSQPHHYIITDHVGNINCISEGLKDVGLLAEYFMHH